MFAGAVGSGGVTEGADEFAGETWPGTEEGEVEGAT